MRGKRFYRSTKAPLSSFHSHASYSSTFSSVIDSNSKSWGSLEISKLDSNSKYQVHVWANSWNSTVELRNLTDGASYHHVGERIVDIEAEKEDCIIKNGKSLFVNDVFQRVDSNAPVVPMRDGYPINPKGLKRIKSVTQTNKFYASLFLDNQRSPVYVHPYTIAWTGCSERRVCHKGIGISQLDESQIRFGPGNPAEYFYSPVNQHSLVFHAVELGSEPKLTTKNADSWAITLQLSSATGNPVLEMPLVQGMGFVTIKYFQATPVIGSLIGIQKLALVGKRKSDATAKYNIELTDRTKWVMFVMTPNFSDLPKFSKQNGSTYVCDAESFTGTIQVARMPANLETNVYDMTAGHYAVGASLKASVMGNLGTYTLNWQKEGLENRTLLMFLLPHHVESIASEDKDKLMALQLNTPTKGLATAVMANRVSLVEPQLPVDIGYYPWSPDRQQQYSCVRDTNRAEFVKSIARKELDKDISHRLDGEQSVYWAAKACCAFTLYFMTNSASSLPITHE
jgi:endo-1,3(4)-beta-glucanase